MTKVIEFIDQVVKETRKINWSTRKETVMSLTMVIVMVVVASLFFLGVDMLMYKIVNVILNLGV